ncbi:uncharacterized protein B0P05DRAFT_586801 [Gilbertella persicaria]|uniref:uncharacterized protein n=1 Tax=Gilbertella persicaria TaxID=101096 RepID=UPI0022208628|nr:uncharacterized protein B0P05DRAFT_586801 [Gilbertella persicaria]KAI8080168.1 hypothetical protein B0P05DRAFT_586801 [Gilbertella persicaria]
MSTESTDTVTKGLVAWEARRKAWTTADLEYTNNLNTTTSDKLQDLIQHEVQRKTIYQQLVYQRQVFRTPIPLKYIIPILITGWQEDGLWPKGMVVQDKSD